MVVSSRLFALSAIVAGAFALPAAAPAPEAIVDFDSETANVTELVRRAQAVNFNQDYVASGANVQYTPNQSAGKFSVSYNTQADFVVGLGWQPGDGK